MADKILLLIEDYVLPAVVIGGSVLMFCLGTAKAWELVFADGNLVCL